MLTLRRGEAGTDGLSQYSTLATKFWGSKQGTAVDCHGLLGVGEQWAAHMGRLPRHGEWPTDHTGQAARYQTGRGWRKLAAVDGKVPASVDREGGQGRLWDRTAGPW